MKQIKKINLPAKFSVILACVTVLGTGFLMWQKYSLSQENQLIREDIEALYKDITRLNNVQDLEKTKAALQTYQKAINYRVPWSAVVGEVFRQETNYTQFLSFSSGREKHININGETTSWEEVSLLIERLKANPRMKGVFISHVAEKVSEKGLVYNFTLTFNFGAS